MIEKNKRKKIVIYTDGACSGNPGKGGWAAILICDYVDKNGITKQAIKEISGSEKDTTNNRMEITAVIEALKLLKIESDVEIYTDSKYVMEGATKWMSNWIKNNWKTSNKKPVKNIDLLEQLSELLQKHNIKWQWVKGHSTNELNNRVDKLARSQCDKE